MTPLITQPQTAALLGMTSTAFSRHLPGLITRDGFPPPVTGDLNNGRKGPRRRWLRVAVMDWIDRQSQPHPTQIARPANDQNGIDKPQSIHYR